MCVNCDCDLDLGRYWHCSDKDALCHLQIGLVFVQNHASVIWPRDLAIVRELDHLLKLFLIRSYCLIVGVLKADDLERYFLFRVELLLWCNCKAVSWGLSLAI